MCCFYVNFEQFFLSLCFIMDCQRGCLLGSKTLGLNVLELQFVMLANHDQNVLVLFKLAQSICFLCKVGIELLQNLLCNSVWLDRSKVVQIVFLQKFPTQPKPVWRVGFYVLS